MNRLLLLLSNTLLVLLEVIVLTFLLQFFQEKSINSKVPDFNYFVGGF